MGLDIYRELQMRPREERKKKKQSGSVEEELRVAACMHDKIKDRTQSELPSHDPYDGIISAVK